MISVGSVAAQHGAGKQVVKPRMARCKGSSGSGAAWNGADELVAEMGLVGRKGSLGIWCVML
jgi:hypothetical protein